MTVAVIGGKGSIGRRHAATLRALGHTVIVFDGADADQARRFGAADIDAAVIATPADTHRVWLRRVSARQLPVYCEKPIGVIADLDDATIEDVDLAGVARQFEGIVTQMGYTWHYRPDVQALYRAVTPRYVRLHVYTRQADWPGSARDGELVPECSHELSLIARFGARLTGVDVTWFDAHHVRVTGALAQGGVWEVQIHANASPARGYAIVDRRRNGTTVVGEWGRSRQAIAAMYRAAMADFCERVAHGTRDRQNDLAHGVDILRLCAAIARERT